MNNDDFNNNFKEIIGRLHDCFERGCSNCNAKTVGCYAEELIAYVSYVQSQNIDWTKDFILPKL